MSVKWFELSICNTMQNRHVGVLRSTWLLNVKFGHLLFSGLWNWISLELLLLFFFFAAEMTQRAPSAARPCGYADNNTVPRLMLVVFRFVGLCKLSAASSAVSAGDEDITCVCQQPVCTLTLSRVCMCVCVCLRPEGTGAVPFNPYWAEWAPSIEMAILSSRG